MAKRGRMSGNRSVNRWLKPYGEKSAALDNVKVYRPKVVVKQPPAKPKQTPDLLTWLLQKNKKDEKKGRVETQ